MWSLLLLLACGAKDSADRDGYSPIEDTAPGPIDSATDTATDSGTTGEPIVYTAIPGASLECDSATTEALLVSAPAAGSLSVIHAAAMSGCCPSGFSAALVQEDPAVLRLREALTVAEDPCDCVCALTARYGVVGLPAGRWTVEAGPQSVEVDVP
jgi:hypothetical protein